MVGGSGSGEREVAALRRRLPAFQPGAVEPTFQHRCVPPHAPQPRRRHARPHPGVVDQHDARTPDAEPAVGLLHQLAARRHHRTWQMAGAVLGRVAHIHHVEGAPVGLALPLNEGCAVDDRHAIALGDGIGALSRRRDALGRDLRRAGSGAGDDPESRQVPRHRPVLQRDDAVRHLGVDQRLRTDDAARAPATIDDDESVGRPHKLPEAIDQLGAGHADRPGDAVGMVFLIGPAVEDRQVLAALLALGQFLGADPRRAVFVLDDLGKRLARHMHTAIDRQPGRFPCLDPAFQHRDIAIAALDEPPRRAVGQPLPMIANHDGGRAPRQQPRSDQLEPRQRQARCHQEMPVVKTPFLAGIDDRDLAACPVPPAQFRRRNASGHPALLR